MVILGGVLSLFAIQAGSFFLSTYLRTYKFNNLFFYLAIFLTSLILYVLARDLNFIGLIIWFIVLNWALWRVLYLTYKLLKQKVFKTNKFDTKRQADFYKKYTLLLFLTILPLLITFSLDYKKFSYSGFANFILILGSFISIIGFLLEILFVGQKIGLEKSATNYIWEKHGVWHFSKLNPKFADIFIWSGVVILTLSSFIN